MVLTWGHKSELSSCVEKVMEKETSIIKKKKNPKEPKNAELQNPPNNLIFTMEFFSCSCFTSFTIHSVNKNTEHKGQCGDKASTWKML